MATVATLDVLLRLDAGDFKKSLDDASTRMESLGKRMQDVGGRLSMNVSAPLAAAGAAAVKFASDFQGGLANVATLIPGSTDRVRELGEAVQEMATVTGQSTGSLTDGLYQVISAFGDTADTADILETNARAAAAGMATVTDAINLTSAVTKAYGDTSQAAVSQVSDLALLAVRLGQTTFPELAASVGRVTPLTAELGVATEELFATMATFTGVTGNAAEVSTQLRGVLQSLLSPTADMEAAFEAMGVSSGKALLEQRGLQGAIEGIVGQAEAAGAPLQKYISSIEGQTLALAAVGGQSDAFTEKLGQMMDATGATDVAFNELENGIGASNMAMARATQEIAVAAQKIGTIMLPAVAALASAVAGLAGWFGDLSPLLQTVGVAFATLLAAVGPVVFILGKFLSSMSLIVSAGGVLTGWLASAAAAFTAAGGAAGIAGAALAVLTGPIGIVAGAIAALTAAWVLWGDEIRAVMAKVREAVQPALDAIGAQFGRLMDVVRTVTNAVAAFVLTMAEEVIARIKAVASVVKDVLVAGFNAIMVPVRTVLQFVTSLVVEFARAVDNTIGAMIRKVRDWMVGTFRTVMDGFVNILRAGIGLVDRIIPGFADRFEERFASMQRAMEDTTEIGASAAIQNVTLMADEVSVVTDRLATDVTEDMDRLEQGVATATARAASAADENTRILAEAMDRNTLAGVERMRVNINQMEPVVATGGSAAVREANRQMAEMEEVLAERSARGVDAAGRAFESIAGKLAGPMGLETDRVMGFLDELGVDMPKVAQSILEKFGPEWSRLIDVMAAPTERLPEVLKNWRQYWDDLAAVLSDFWSIAKSIVGRLVDFFKSSNEYGQNVPGIGTGGGVGIGGGGSGPPVPFQPIPGWDPKILQTNTPSAVMSLHEPLNRLIELTVQMFETAGATLGLASGATIVREVQVVLAQQSLEVQRQQLTALERIEAAVRDTNRGAPGLQGVAAVSGTMGVEQIDEALGARAELNTYQRGRVTF